VEETLQRVPVRKAASVQEILDIDEQSRFTARKIVSERAGNFRQRRQPVEA
jgi:hypothetical protein